MEKWGKIMKNAATITQLWADGNQFPKGQVEMLNTYIASVINYRLTILLGTIWASTKDTLNACSGKPSGWDQIVIRQTSLA